MVLLRNCPGHTVVQGTQARNEETSKGAKAGDNTLSPTPNRHNIPLGLLVPPFPTSAPLQIQGTGGTKELPGGLTPHLVSQGRQGISKW